MCIFLLGISFFLCIVMFLRTRRLVLSRTNWYPGTVRLNYTTRTRIALIVARYVQSDRNVCFFSCYNHQCHATYNHQWVPCDRKKETNILPWDKKSFLGYISSLTGFWIVLFICIYLIKNNFFLILLYLNDLVCLVISPGPVYIYVIVEVISVMFILSFSFFQSSC